MKRTAIISTLLTLASMIAIPLLAQAPPGEHRTAPLDHPHEQPGVADAPINRDALEEELVGHWVLEGTLAGKQTTHDVDAQWVLNREYLQIHEVSRQKKADGNPRYEAIVYVAWDGGRHEYSCLWLDSTEQADFRRLVIAHAKPESNKIPFIFNLLSGDTFHTTFSYDERTDTWEWLLENRKGSTVVPFGHVRLTRKNEVNQKAD